MSKYLKNWARLNGVSKGELARRTGLDPTHMGRIVEGTHNLTQDVARKVAESFDIDAEQLYKDIAIYKPVTEDERRAFAQLAAQLDRTI